MFPLSTLSCFPSNHFKNPKGSWTLRSSILGITGVTLGRVINAVEGAEEEEEEEEKEEEEKGTLLVDI